MCLYLANIDTFNLPSLLVATPILTLWNDGKDVKVHNKIVTDL